MGIRLLTDIALFREKLEKLEHIQTVDLLGFLYSDGEEPWSDWWKGKNDEGYGKRATMGLSKLLREFGVAPKQFWELGENRRGYETASLLELLGRYIGDKVGRSLDSASAQGLRDSEVASPSDLTSDRKPSGDAGSSDPSDLLAVESPLDLGTASLGDLLERFKSPLDND